MDKDKIRKLILSLSKNSLEVGYLIGKGDYYGAKDPAEKVKSSYNTLLSELDMESLEEIDEALSCGL